MGADSFCVKAKGIYKTVEEAFNELVEDACYEHGNSGYTGTIAEKSSFKMIEIPGRKDVNKFIDECFDDEEHFVQSKWGDAACIELKGKRLQDERGEEFKGKRNFRVCYFFGWASS